MQSGELNPRWIVVFVTQTVSRFVVRVMDAFNPELITHTLISSSVLTPVATVCQHHQHAVTGGTMIPSSSALVSLKLPSGSAAGHHDGGRGSPAAHVLPSMPHVRLLLRLLTGL